MKRNSVFSNLLTMSLIFIILCVPDYANSQETKQKEKPGKVLMEGNIDLRWSLTWDRQIALVIYYVGNNGRIGDEQIDKVDTIEIAQNFNGKYATSDDAKNGEIFLLRRGIEMPNAVTKVGELIVQPAKKGGKAQLKICVVSETPDKYIQGSTSFLSTSQLNTVPGIKGFTYGLSIDNDIILLKIDGNNISVLKDHNGRHAINVDLKADDLLNGDYHLSAATEMPDGRIKIDNKVDRRSKLTK